MPNSSRTPQLNRDGELHHLLAIDGLPRVVIERILNTADSFINVAEREVKSVPLLRGKSVFNLVFENSTRTRTTFEIAARRLSADVFNLDIVRSSAAKGESLLDTINNLTAMQADMFVVRHATSGAPYLIARHTSAHAPHIHVINAGDGRRPSKQGFSTPTRSGTTRRTSATSSSQLSETSCIHEWRGRTFMC